MKSAFVAASAASLTAAVNIQQSGYYIDLCPDEAASAYASAPVFTPNNSQLLAREAALGFSTDKVGSSELSELELMTKFNRIQDQEILKAGISAFRAEKRLEQMEKLEKLEKIQALAAAMEQIGAYEEELLLTEQPLGIAEYEIAAYPGTAFNMVVGREYSPSTQVAASFDLINCPGQAVQVYNDNNEVLWCGERNVQGNQTLKRTNIHHNYVHDIAHMHNYHNRVKHAARQFNTVEKDCSCKGVAVEAPYACPPEFTPQARLGSNFIEAKAARAVAANLLAARRVGEVTECACTKSSF